MTFSLWGPTVQFGCPHSFSLLSVSPSRILRSSHRPPLRSSPTGHRSSPSSLQFSFLVFLQSSLFRCGVAVQNGSGLMTDKQMELLRKQISVYATICEQLVENLRCTRPLLLNRILLE